MLKAENIHLDSPWQEMTPGGEIYEGGTSRMTRTGDWRTKTPLLDAEKCKQCMLCVPFCPDSAIPVQGDARGAFDLDHCKGCGICAKVCPFGAIRMTQEGE